MYLFNQSSDKVYALVVDRAVNVNTGLCSVVGIPITDRTKTLEPGERDKVNLGWGDVCQRFVFFFLSKADRDALKIDLIEQELVEAAGQILDVLLKVPAGANTFGRTADLFGRFMWDQFASTAFAKKYKIVGAAVVPQGKGGFLRTKGEHLWVVYWDKDLPTDQGEFSDKPEMDRILKIVGGPPKSCSRIPGVYGQLLDLDAPNPVRSLKAKIQVMDKSGKSPLGFLDMDDGNNHFAKNSTELDVGKAATWSFEASDDEWRRVTIKHDERDLYLHPSDKYGPLARGRDETYHWAFLFHDLGGSEVVTEEKPTPAEGALTTIIAPSKGLALGSKYHIGSDQLVKETGEGGGVLLLSDTKSTQQTNRTASYRLLLV